MLRNFVRIKNIKELIRPCVLREGKQTKIIQQRCLATDGKNFARTATDQEEIKKKHVNPFVQAETEQEINKEKVNPFAQNSSMKSEKSFDSIEKFTQNESMSEEEKAKRLKVLQLEVDIANQEGRRVPQLDFLKDHHWEHILSLPSKSARIKYYAYLWQIEMKQQSRGRKKIERAEAVQERKEMLRKENEENNHIIYGLSHTTLFLRIYDSTINHWQNNRLIRAMQFSPKIVMDCSYDQYMTKREAVNAAKQLMLSFAENRAHDDPFDVHYCNVNMSSPCMQSLKRYIPTMLNPEFPMNVHEQCFTKIFPKENLVYLTPHCRNDLEEYNPDDVYIVGAMVDTVNNEPLSLAKAKKLGIRMARLPLDRYLQWGSGSGKSLTLNQMINIMLDIKSTGNWEKSLVHVPRRKIVDMQLDRRSLEKRAGKLNVNIDQLIKYDEQANNSYTARARPVRSHKDKLQFNLETWGSNKKRNKF